MQAVPPAPAARPLFIPVILGTVRMGRRSASAARVVTAELEKREGIETELIDIARVQIATDNEGEATKDPVFATKMERADGLVMRRRTYGVRQSLAGFD